MGALQRQKSRHLQKWKFEDVDVVVVEAAKRRCCSRYCSRNGADDVDMETVEVDVAG